jgi:hypothetical protein
VKIAELHDAQTIKTGGQTPQGELEARYFQGGSVVIESAGADGGQAGSAKRGRCQELPASQGQIKSLANQYPVPRV